ncbi:hypothetical protein F4823DRAFT_633745 [Ustulina deusta]|nr:hypothetical protein F4823DRAFT_633745 [Ustulina deusta]
MGPDGEKLTRGDSWRPFGGGKTMWSGRHIAKRAIQIFLAMVLLRFDVTIVGGVDLPPTDLGRPVLGIIAVKFDQDYNVRLTERSVPA